MSTYIDGKEEILDIWNGTDAYEPIVCLISNGLSESVDEITARTKCDANGSTQKKAGAYSYEIPFEGIYAEDEASKIGWSELREKLRSLENFDWRITTNYGTGSDVEYGNAYFSSLEKTSANDEYISFSGTLVGNGLITATDPHA